MSLKNILGAALVAALAASTATAQSVTATASSVVNGDGNRVWTVTATPNAGDLPGSLAAELEFTIDTASAEGTLSVVDGDADNTNGSDNDTWYYNETSAGSGTLLWNITANDASDETQNPNPFSAGNDGLQVSGATASAGLGSTIFAAGTTDINVLQIVTSGGGGVLNMSAGNLAQNGGNNNIAAASFYVPGDFTGDGRADSSDVTALLGAFGMPAANFPGFQPVTGDNMAGSGDVTALLGNFGAGTAAPGAGSGSAVPEPTSIALLSMVMGLGLLRRRS